MNVYRVRITLPSTFEFFTVLDQTGRPWYFWFDEAGQLTHDSVLPTSVLGLRRIDVGIIPTPSWIKMLDELAVAWFLAPQDDLGDLVPDTAPPALGTEWDVFSKLTLRSLDPTIPYDLTMESITRYWQQAQQAPVAVPDDFLHFSAGSDAPFFDGVLWEPRLETVLNVETRLFQGENIFAGRVVPRFGTIEIANGDGALDVFLPLVWEGREIVISRRTDPLGAFSNILNGSIAEATWTHETLIFTLADVARDFSRAVQQTLYRGNGGNEGGPELAGRPKPLAYGAPRNVAPVLLDRFLLIYQVHDGSMQAVENVFDRSVPLASAGDITALSLPIVDDWLPVGGQYITDLARGLLRLGAEPEGIVTADIQGDNTGGHVQTTSTIVRRLATQRGPLTDPTDIDTAAFDALEALQPASISYYSGTSPTTLAAVLDQCMGSVGGFWGLTTTGLLTVGLIGFTAPTTTLRTRDLLALERVTTPRVAWRVRLGYARAWATQNQEELDEIAATQARKDFVIEAYRYSVAENAFVLDQRPTAREIDRTTFLDSQGAADAEAIREFDLVSIGRDQYRAEVHSQVFAQKAGDTVTLAHDRFGLDAGIPMLVIGVTEDTETETTLLELWG